MISKTRQGLLISVDIILAYLSLLITIAIGFWGDFSWFIFGKHFFPFTLLYLSWFIIFYIFGLYDLHLIRPKLKLTGRLGGALLTSFLLGISFFYIIPIFDITPKTNLLINIVALGLLIFLWRRSFYKLFSSRGLQRVIFLGETIEAKNLAKKIKESPQLGYELVGFLDTSKPLIKQIKNKNIDTLIIAKDIRKDKEITEELYKCLELKIDFISISESYETLLYKIPIDLLDQTWFLENLKEGQKRIYDNVKRIEDIIVSSIILIVTSPLWIIFSIIIKMEDGGKVLYKQERIGKDKEKFNLIKFRSMRPDAEKDGAKWAKKKDNRVTKVGKFLRASHLDEIPQMVNILKGDISLVGPRPERPIFVRKLEKEIPYYHLRHIIKPGFTGWAQIKFRYARTLMDSHHKFQYDLYYIKNRSFFLDLGIFLKSFQLFFKNE